MDTNALDTFITEIMDIKNIGLIANVGGLSAAAIGASPPGSDLTQQLKKTALAFSDECRQPNPDNKRLSALAREIEGMLNNLRALSVVSNEKHERLTETLYGLVLQRQSS